jgi:hypothetical protein
VSGARDVYRQETISLVHHNYLNKLNTLACGSRRESCFANVACEASSKERCGYLARYELHCCGLCIRTRDVVDNTCGVAALLDAVYDVDPFVGVIAIHLNEVDIFINTSGMDVPFTLTIIRVALHFYLGHPEFSLPSTA